MEVEEKSKRKGEEEGRRGRRDRVERRKRRVEEKGRGSGEIDGREE